MLKIDNNPALIYDQVTSAWLLLLGHDLHYGYFLDPAEPLAAATSRLTQMMAEWAALSPGLEVLDIGCGIGNPALFIAESFGCRVTGISTSEVGLEIAASQARSRHLENRVRFELRDGMANGFPDSSFDRAWVLESSHLMPRRNDLIAEAARVLRPGGKLILCDIILRAAIPLPELFRDRKIFNTLDTVFGKAKMEALDTYRMLAGNNGLQVIRAEDISAAVRPTFDRWRDNAAQNREAIIELVGEDYLSRFVSACDYLENLWHRGKLGYGMMLAVKQ